MAHLASLALLAQKPTLKADMSFTETARHAVGIIHFVQLSDQQQSSLLKMACQSIREALADGGKNAPACDDPMLRQPAGCFVSLHVLADHRLRGCVGRIEAEHALWDVVWATAGNALRDPRFQTNPVTIGELPSLSIELSVLSPLRPASHPLDFEPQTHGIYLMCAGRSGCFLPQVGRQTGWSREQLLGRLCTEKMGLPSTFWMNSGALLQTFTALVVGPVSFQSAEAGRSHVA